MTKLTAVIFDRYDHIVAAATLDTEYSYQAADFFTRLQEGDTVKILSSRRTAAERLADAKAEAEREEAARLEDGVNKAAELRKAADQLEAGAISYSQVARKFSDEIPF